MVMFRGSVHIYGTMDDAVRLVAVYAKHMALEIGDELAHFTVKEDWFDAFKLVQQWLEYNPDLTTDDLPKYRKVLEISCIFDLMTKSEPHRFVENTIDAALADFFRYGRRPNSGDPASIPWASSSEELGEEAVERFRQQFPGVID